MARTRKGIIYPNNYDEIADIPEAMKDMAESIDEVFDDVVTYDDTEVKADISDLQDDVSNLNTDITDLNTNKANKNEVYTKTEADDLLEGKADNEDIPSKTSDLTNDNGFIDKNVNNLTNYTLKVNTGSLIDLEINQSTYVVTLRLKDVDGNIISSDTIDLPLENVVIGGSFDSVNKKIVLTLENGNTVDIPVGDLVAGLQTEITSSNKLASDLVDDSNSGNKFVTTSEKQRWNDKLDESDLTDYVKNTDYATASKGGVVKTAPNDYASSISNGYLLSQTKTYAQYTNGTNNMFISKGTMENVITGKGLINQTTLDESQAEQDTQIQNNTDNIEALESLIPTGTATGESIEINDSARYKFKEFNIGGNTKQQTYSGKNSLKLLLNEQVTRDGITYTPNKDGSVTISGTRESDGTGPIFAQISITENQDFYIMCINRDTNSIENIAIQLYGTLDKYRELGFNRSYNLDFSGTYNVNIKGANTGITVNGTYFFMLVPNSDSIYEPYVRRNSKPFTRISTTSC